LGHAQIHADGKKINCIVRNLSEKGAKLGVSRDAQLPSRFTLCFVLRKLKLPVRLRWRRGDFAGVSFEPPEGPNWDSATRRRTYILDA
jgi:hypothetical protein